MFLDLLFSKLFQLPENSAIIIYQGGLGNQLFQYFLGQELEKKYNKNVFYYDLRDNYKTIHNSDIKNLFDLNLKKYNFGKFNFILRFFFLSPIFLKFNKFIFLKFKHKIFSNYFFDPIWKPINLEDISYKKNIIIFFGTWHNLINQYKYSFNSYNIKFSKNIHLPESFDFNKKFISLHVRRGDYCNPKTAKFHGNLDIKYYLNGINFLRNKFGNIPVLLFSDDYKWIQKNLSYLIPNSHIISSPKLSSEIDFYIMTKGSYFILSNSTFAWLSAYLANYKDKFVIVPSFWFKDKKISPWYIYKNWKYKVI